MGQLTKADKAVFALSGNGNIIFADEAATALLEETDIRSLLETIDTDTSEITLTGKGSPLCLTVRFEPLSSDLALIILTDNAERTEFARLASLGSIMPSIAHEMRNPLTGIGVLLDDIHDRLTGQEDERRLIRMLLSEVERLEMMLSDALVFSGGGTPSMFEENIGEILSEVLMLNHKFCSINRVSVIADISQDIPPVLADGNKLKQAFHNLIINAVESMAGGGNLTVSAHVSDNTLNIHVSDTGSGIPEDKLHMIFEPFFTDKSKGTGIGLSVVREVIRKHGGEISVRSEVGKGTDFHITLNL